MESPIDDFLQALDRFNKQFQLKEPEWEAVTWAWPQESGDTMFHLVNTYTKASQMEGLPAVSSYRLQKKVAGEVLANVMLNKGGCESYEHRLHQSM